MLLRSIAIEEIVRQRPPKFNRSRQRVRKLGEPLQGNDCGLGHDEIPFLFAARSVQVRNNFHMANLGVEMPTVYRINRMTL
jgi:hypothetical protein